jgi:hypothetical protein
MEGFLEAVERLLASRMFKERGHVQDPHGVEWVRGD